MTGADPVAEHDEVLAALLTKDAEIGLEVQRLLEAEGQGSGQHEIWLSGHG